MDMQQVLLQDLIQEIFDLHSEMKPLLIRAGINEDVIQRPAVAIGSLDDSEIRELHTWIKEIYDKEYKELYTIFKLPADDTLWDKYKQFGVEGLPEQKLFNRAARELRRAWSLSFRKKSNATTKETGNGDAQRDQVNTESISVQPET